MELDDAKQLQTMQFENMNLRAKLAAAEKSNQGMREAVGRWQARAQKKRPAEHQETLVSLKQKLEYDRNTDRERWREYRTMSRDLVSTADGSMAGPDQISEVRIFLASKILEKNPMAQLVSVEFKNETWFYTTAHWA